MKKILLVVMCGLLVLGFTGCKKEEVKQSDNKQEEKKEGYNEVREDSKSLVLYFSATGTTENVAKTISDATDSDIVEIVPKDKYTSDDLNYSKDDTRANKEMQDENARPEIENEIDIAKYETIYIGYPIWWGTNPRIILTLLDNVNFDGKNVLLFCTSGSSGIEQSVKELKEYNSKINFLGGKRFTSSVTKDEINAWVKDLK